MVPNFSTRQKNSSRGYPIKSLIIALALSTASTNNEVLRFNKISKMAITQFEPQRDFVYTFTNAQYKERDELRYVVINFDDYISSMHIHKATLFKVEGLERKEEEDSDKKTGNGGKSLPGVQKRPRNPKDRKIGKNGKKGISKEEEEIGTWVEYFSTDALDFEIGGGGQGQFVDNGASWIFSENFYAIPLLRFKKWRITVSIHPQMYLEDLKTNPEITKDINQSKKPKQRKKETKTIKKTIQFEIGIFSDKNINISPNFYTPGFIGMKSDMSVLTIDKKTWKPGFVNTLEISVCKGELGVIQVVKLGEDGRQHMVGHWEMGKGTDSVYRIPLSFEQIFGVAGAGAGQPVSVEAPGIKQVKVRLGKKKKGEEVVFKVRLFSLPQKLSSLFGVKGLRVENEGKNGSLGEKGRKGGENGTGTWGVKLLHSGVKNDLRLFLRDFKGVKVEAERRRKFGVGQKTSTNRVFGVEIDSSQIKDLHLEVTSSEEKQVLYASTDYNEARFMRLCGFHPRIWDHYQKTAYQKNIKKLIDFTASETNFAARVLKPSETASKMVVIDLRNKDPDGPKEALSYRKGDHFSQSLRRFRGSEGQSTPLKLYFFVKQIWGMKSDYISLGVKVSHSQIFELPLSPENSGLFGFGRYELVGLSLSVLTVFIVFVRACAGKSTGEGESERNDGRFRARSRPEDDDEDGDDDGSEVRDRARRRGVIELQGDESLWDDDNSGEEASTPPDDDDDDEILTD